MICAAAWAVVHEFVCITDRPHGHLPGLRTVGIRTFHVKVTRSSAHYLSLLLENAQFCAFNEPEQYKNYRFEHLHCWVKNVIRCFLGLCFFCKHTLFVQTKNLSVTNVRTYPLRMSFLSTSPIVKPRKFAMTTLLSVLLPAVTTISALPVTFTFRTTTMSSPPYTHGMHMTRLRVGGRLTYIVQPIRRFP